MPGNAFLVIELPGLEQVFAEYASSHPGATIDLVMQPLRPGHADLTMQACLLVRDAPPGTLEGLLADARQRYGLVRTLRRDDAEGTWLGTLQVPPASLTDPHALAVMRFLQRHGLGLRWARIEEGVCYFRCEVEDAAQASALAERCRGYLEGLDIDAEVAVEMTPPRDLGLWRELAVLAAQSSPSPAP
jgi:hypothetical protein